MKLIYFLYTDKLKTSSDIYCSQKIFHCYQYVKIFLFLLYILIRDCYFFTKL